MLTSDFPGFLCPEISMTVPTQLTFILFENVPTFTLWYVIYSTNTVQLIASRCIVEHFSDDQRKDILVDGVVAGVHWQKLALLPRPQECHFAQV